MVYCSCLSTSATITAAGAEEETLALCDDRLKNTDLDALRRRVLTFMSKTRQGPEPTKEEVR